VWIARHRLQIRNSFLNAMEPVGLKRRFKLSWFQLRR